MGATTSATNMNNRPSAQHPGGRVVSEPGERRGQRHPHEKAAQEQEVVLFGVPMNLTLPKPSISRSTSQRNMNATEGSGSALACRLGSASGMGRNSTKKPTSCSMVSQGKISPRGSSESQIIQASSSA